MINDCAIAFLSGMMTDSRGKRMCESVEIWRRTRVIADYLDVNKCAYKVVKAMLTVPIMTTSPFGTSSTRFMCQYTKYVAIKSVTTREHCWTKRKNRTISVKSASFGPLVNGRGKIRVSSMLAVIYVYERMWCKDMGWGSVEMEISAEVGTILDLLASSTFGLTMLRR
jgi:hypothetical protein